MKKMITIIAAALAMTATVSVQAAPMDDTVNPNWRAEAYGENFKMKAIAGETNMVQTDEDLVYTYVATESCWMEITSENSMDAYVDIYNTEGIELYYGDDITDENDESLSADFRAVCWMEAGETYEFSFRSMEEDEKEYQVNIRKAAFELAAAEKVSDGVELTWAELPTWDIPTYAVLRKGANESEWTIVGTTEETCLTDTTAKKGETVTYAVCGMDYVEETMVASLVDANVITVAVA